MQSEDALSRAERINDLLNKWKLLTASFNSSVSVDIVEYFAINPYLIINKISKKFNIAYTTAQRVINKLESSDIIRQVDGNKRNKVYCATEILSILEEPTKIF